ncbi:PREDICTED: 5-hydroxytryptamine receptor 3A-like [Branchiostoma belcheri]|uniref:5-hydroxytryptamine receptor 3A-like n=1 Tax=Branchiostoma belcheri TaxID=7741 RepID=A0A6P5A9Z1_BRABE|nr:PREDICTED: 5-hydroxytryptamine receptor 3A-like [Branchiostoma belcheri]
MTVRLFTDSSETRKGFQADYTSGDKVFSECEVGKYRCADGVTCIDAWKRCDGNNDCRDGSDEAQSNCGCQDIQLTLCRGLEYNMMTLPNPLNFNDTTVDQVESSAAFNDLSALAESGCHPKVKDLVCATILPRCNESPNRQQLPCRSWCEEVKYSCDEEDSWSAFPNCVIFPYTNCNNVNPSTTASGAECYDGNGVNYRGDETKGPVAGVTCERWEDDPTFIEPYPWANLVDNKCRNPDGDWRGPWCFTSSGFQYCDLIPCDGVGCQDPGKPRFGKRSPILKYYWQGDRITYTCDSGFKFKKYVPERPNKAQCVYNNDTGEANWDTAKPDCEVDQKFKLQQDLLSANVYNKAASPTTSLQIKAYVVNVINLDEKGEQIVTAFKAEYTWKDDRLEWEPNEYGKVDRIFILDDQIWKPTLTLERNADTGYSGGFPTTEVKMENTGKISWPVEALTTTTCTLDPFLFPQDNMTCAVCWRAGEEYTIDCSNSTTHKDSSFLTCQNNEAPIVTGEWSGTTILSAVNNTACLTMRLKRDPTYHYSTTISPCLILIILMIITFIMPIDKGDRIGFGVTVLLSMVVSLVVVTGFLPVSTTLPFIAMLIIVCMALMALFMLTTLFIIIIHDKKGPVPKWVRTVFLKHVARALLMGDLTKKLKNEEASAYTVSNKVNDVEGSVNHAFKRDGDGSSGPPLNVKNEVGATLIGLKESVDELKVSVKELSGSIDGLASGDDDEEVAEYALLAKVLDRLSLVLYIIAIIVAIPCTLLIGRPKITVG